MLITYRRTGGIVALVVFGVVAVAAAVLTVAVAASALLVVAGGAAIALIVRALLPASWRRRTVPAAAPWPQETIEGTVVEEVESSRDRT
jgi:hypothetical protein